MPATRPTFTARFERAQTGTWAVVLVEEPNLHASGRTLAEARRNIRDTIGTLFGPFEADGDGFQLVEDIRLPETVLTMVDRASAERKRAKQQREGARAAEKEVATMTSDALAATRQAARLLVEHGELVKAESERPGLVADVRVPEAVLQAVERAQTARQAARQQGAVARAAQEAANAISIEATVTNRKAARLLTRQCGLSPSEAASLLGLSPETVQRLLTG